MRPGRGGDGGARSGPGRWTVRGAAGRWTYHPRRDANDVGGETAHGNIGSSRDFATVSMTHHSPGTSWFRFNRSFWSPRWPGAVSCRRRPARAPKRPPEREGRYTHAPPRQRSARRPARSLSDGPWSLRTAPRTRQTRTRAAGRNLQAAPPRTLDSGGLRAAPTWTDPHPVAPRAVGVGRPTGVDISHASVAGRREGGPGLCGVYCSYSC